jgi:hypothetical protein
MESNLFEKVHNFEYCKNIRDFRLHKTKIFIIQNFTLYLSFNK